MCVWVCITLMLYYTCEWRVLHMYTLVRRLGVLTNSPFNLFSLFLVSLLPTGKKAVARPFSLVFPYLGRASHRPFPLSVGGRRAVASPSPLGMVGGGGSKPPPLHLTGDRRHLPSPAPRYRVLEAPLGATPPRHYLLTRASPATRCKSATRPKPAALNPLSPDLPLPRTAHRPDLGKFSIFLAKSD